MRERRAEVGTGRGPFVAIAGLALVGVALSALLLQHHASPGGSTWSFVRAVCGDGVSGCDVVNRSAASRLLGVPVAQWGLWFYGAILVQACAGLLHGRLPFVTWILAFGILGFLADVALFSYSLFGLGTVCNLCALTYGATVGILGIALLALRRVGPALAPAAVLAIRREERARAIGLLLFGGLAVLASGAWMGERWGGGRGRYEALYEDPDEALRLAWSAFYERYEETEAVAIDVAGSPVKGAAQPILQLVLFADFLCTHCRRTATLLDEFVGRHRDTVALVYKHYPLDPTCNAKSQGIHPGACLLARTSACADEQGKFWRFHDYVFANQDLLLKGMSPALLEELARRAGLDAEALAGCREGESATGAVARDIEQAESIGVESTPALFINGKRMQSIPIPTFLEELLRQEAERKQPISLGGWPQGTN